MEAVIYISLCFYVDLREGGSQIFLFGRNTLHPVCFILFQDTLLHAPQIPTLLIKTDHLQASYFNAPA